MELKEVLTEQHCAEFIKHVCSNLRLSFTQLKDKYATYSTVALESIDAGDNQKNLEIRLGNEDITMTCSFNEGDTCESIFLFPDCDYFVRDMLKYLRRYYGHFKDQRRFSLRKINFEVIGNQDCYFLKIYHK